MSSGAIVLCTGFLRDEELICITKGVKVLKTLKKIILSVYLFLIVCIYPLYIRNGYYDLCVVKSEFLYIVSGVTFVLLLIVLGIELFYRMQFGLKDKVNWKNINITEKFLLMYCAIIVVSYMCSDFQDEVLWGTYGWYMGTILLLLMSGLALMTSYSYKFEKTILYHFVIASSFVFALGICNRFSFYPIMDPFLPTFISTLGNINWFCGYMSIVAPIGISLFVFTETEKTIGRTMLFLYSLLTFTTGFCQGSSSVFLWEGIMFFALLWICLRKMQWIKNWFLVLFLWGLSGQIVRVLKYLLPDYFNYKYAKLIDTNLTLMVAVFSLIVYIVLKFYEKNMLDLSEEIIKRIHKWLLICLFSSFFVYILLSMVNTTVGISFLQGNSLFTWDVSWGTDRGFCFSVAFLIFNKMPFIKKMIGIGADGFYSFAYSDYEIAEYINSYFEDAELTNAHNELLTNLVNLGVLGTIAYIGIFATFFIQCMKRGKEDSIAYVFAICVVCYFANNLVSFAQIYNTPYLFLLLGIGGAYLRKSE